jgi:dTDP-4-amino-4,6-dideoxygalactose transaminase
MIHQIETEKINLKFIPYCEHTVSVEEINEVIDTLNSNWLTRGPKTFQFEKAFSDYIGCEYTVAVSSCTAALHLALSAYDIKPGDEIITTPMTFCATAEAIEYLQAKPIFVDIDPTNFNIDVNRIEEKITPRTRAILPVHYGGIPCDLEIIYDLAKHYDLKVLEDAAHATGTIYKNKKIGSFGYPATFSFYPTKNMTTCEGGALTTDDHSLAEKIRILSLHGISQDAWKRYDCQGNWFYEVTHLGYKYNFTDLQAALGLQQLKKLDYFNSIRENHAKRYFDELQIIQGVLMPEWYYTYFNELRFKGIKNCWHLFVIMVDERYLKIGRNQFIDELKARHIGTSVHFIPLHLHSYYAQKYGYKWGDFEVAESIYGKIISLPLYPKLREHQLQYIIDSIRQIVRKYRI